MDYGKETYEDFEYYIKIGCETEFEYKGEEYIVTHCDGKTELYNDTTQEGQYFDDRIELLEKARIDGKSLKELFPEIHVTCWS